MKNHELDNVKVGDILVVVGNSHSKGQKVTVIEFPKRYGDHAGCIMVRLEDGQERVMTHWNVRYPSTENKVKFPKIYAGLDEDGIAKLYSVDEHEIIRRVYHEEWIKILDNLNAKPGEMLRVYLRKEIAGDKR